MSRLFTYIKPAFYLAFTLVLSACLTGPDNVTTSQAASAAISDDSLPEQTNEVDQTEPEDNSFFYFSYDDSASTASRDLTFFAIEQGTQPSISWGRPYEYLNAESLGHFSSTHAAGPFEVSIGAYQSSASELVLEDSEDNFLSLGINLTGPTIDKSARKNLVLTLLVDTSGSMNTEFSRNYESVDGVKTRLDVVQYGLQELYDALKPGDVVNLVEFNSSANTLVEDWRYEEGGNEQSYLAMVDELRANNSTNLDAGIQLAYTVANRVYDETKANRVILLTDAFVNTGVTDSSVIAEHTVINGLEGIYLSGIGVGFGFNDDFLNELTDIGKGSYSAMITPEDAKRLFSEQFMRFIDHAVEGVRFKLDYPQSWQHLVSAAEETSQQQNDVRTINFAYNSEQFFFEVFSSSDAFENEQSLQLVIQYKEDGQSQEATVDVNLNEILDQGIDNIKAAGAVNTLANLVAQSISCQQLEDSDFNSLNSSHTVWQKYIDAIQSYCSY